MAFSVKHNGTFPVALIETNRRFVEGVFASESKALGVGVDWIELQQVETSPPESIAVDGAE